MTKKQKAKTDNDISMTVVRPISIFIARLFSKTNITPNQITLLNFIILAPLTFYFLIQGTYINNLVALFFIFGYSLFDAVDGSLARMKSLESKLGSWLDSSLGTIYQNLLFCAIIIGVYIKTENWLWFLPGIFVLFGQNIANYLGFRYERDFGFDAYSGSKKFNQKFANLKKISLWDSFCKNIIVPSKFLYIFLFCCRYLLVLGILFNRLDIFLTIFAITINIRWLTMYFLYLRYLYDTKSKLYTVKFLAELYKYKNEDNRKNS